MQINLVRGYFVDVDRLNYCLKKTVDYENRKGERAQRDIIIGYYPRMSVLIQRLAELEHIDSDEVLEMKTFVCKVDKVNEQLVDELKEALEKFEHRAKKEVDGDV